MAARNPSSPKARLRSTIPDRKSKRQDSAVPGIPKTEELTVGLSGTARRSELPRYQVVLVAAHAVALIEPIQLKVGL